MPLDGFAPSAFSLQEKRSTPELKGLHRGPGYFWSSFTALREVACFCSLVAIAAFVEIRITAFVEIRITAFVEIRITAFYESAYRTSIRTSNAGAFWGICGFPRFYVTILTRICGCFLHPKSPQKFSGFSPQILTDFRILEIAAEISCL